MRKVILIIFALLTLLEASYSTEPTWKNKMEELRTVLTKLLPIVVSDNEFNSPNNFQNIERYSKQLAELAHKMPKGELPADTDPSLGLISMLFKDEIVMANLHLRNGNRQYARRILLNVPKYCIACHTRSTVPIDLTPVQQSVPASLKSSFERAQYFETTWQFDRALEEFEKIVKDPMVEKTSPLEWQKAANLGIATAVRVQNDPDRALVFVNTILSSSSAPQFLKNDAQEWRASLLEWQKEPAKVFEDKNQLLNEAQRLVDLAKAKQKYPTDRNANILYLRATSVLHDFLRKSPENSNAAEALLLLGVCYEILQDLELWSLHELYFEACIRVYPHSPIAETCYKRYEQSLFVGYSGSGGVALPAELMTHLNDLRKLAGPY
ncbi:MAG TPA: hypothetical protein VLH08_23100 [Acidobacteriota bacterium]|nr:hypothetical protein [Acidobacteriota bacterium]